MRGGRSGGEQARGIYGEELENPRGEPGDRDEGGNAGAGPDARRLRINI